MMDEKQIESLKRRYGSRIADAPKRRRGRDGANDLQMIAAAGFGFAYHGKPVVMREAPRGVRFGDFSVLKHCFLEAWA